jgi:autotransporter family porin
MKTYKILAIAIMLCLAALTANTQTLSRSLVLKPAGSAFTATIDLTAAPAASWSLDFPDGSLAATGPFMKVSTASGNKGVSFGQVTLTSNGAAGDITGILGVSNGGTGLATLAANSILLGNGTSAMNSVAVGTAGQVLSIVGSTPTWSTTIGGGGVTTNINSSGTPNITNIDAGTATAGTTNIGNATSTTAFLGTVTFGTAPSIPLTLNNMWVGNASNVQTQLAPTANAVMITSGTGNLVPTWTTSLPIALGGTNSAATPTAGGVAYGNATQYQFTGAGTAGFVLQSNGAAAPTWVSVNSLVAGLSAQYTVLAADQTAGFATITPAIAGYSITSKIMITYQSVSGPAEAAAVNTQTATTFQVNSGAMTTGDKITYIIIN